MIKFFKNFFLIFVTFGLCLLFKLDSSFYTSLTFHVFKPSLNFFHVFNFVYVILISLSLTEIISLYQYQNLGQTFYFKLLLNFISFVFIRVFFNMHHLLFCFLSSMLLFISLLYVYEEISFLNEKSTRYLDINVLYSLILSAFTFCLYVLNCS